MIPEKYCLSDSKVVVPNVPVGIVGVGSYLPDTKIENHDFTNLTLNSSEREFIENMSGIRQRHLAVGEDYTDMAVKAAQNALDTSGIAAQEIDLVVVTHTTRDLNRLTPPNSTLIQTRLNAKNATSINVDMGFSGWIYALTTGASFVASGFYETVLVVSGESLLSHTDSTVMKALLVGDGAGAFILRKTEQGMGMLAHHLMSWEVGEEAAIVGVNNAKAGPASEEFSTKCYFSIAENSFERDLPFVKNYLPYSVRKVLSEYQIKPQEVDHYVLAQKFEWLNREWAKLIEIDYSLVRDTLCETACVETASIPIITDNIYKRKLLKKGDLVVFADLGSKWSVGAALFRWCID